MIPQVVLDEESRLGTKEKREHMLYFYRKPLLSEERAKILLEDLQAVVPEIIEVRTEKVFTIASDRRLANTKKRRLKWLLRNRHQPKGLSEDIPFLQGDDVIEINPRLAFETPESTNAVSICKEIGLDSVHRLEQGRRFKILSSRQLSTEEWETITRLLYDPMVEEKYDERIKTFEIPKELEPIVYIPVLEKGVEALKEAKVRYNLAMDEFDMNFYAWLIQEFGIRLTLESLKDLDNCNSEHSRHHKFRARLVIDGEVMPFTLMELIKSTLKNPENSIIAFHDNASAIRGFVVSDLIPTMPGMPSPIRMAELLYHFVLTCETHNHPCLWAAYPGAATGRGGRYRDNAAVGRGGMSTGSIAGFFGGNLNDPRRPLSWEYTDFKYDPRVESPLEFFIAATRGAFDDGNEAGEPLIELFFETFGMKIGDERWENIKPIMFTGGSGLIRNEHVKKNPPVAGLIVAKMGGPAIAVGISGGAASSCIQGDLDAKLDYSSVQRANGEMAKKVDMVIFMNICRGLESAFEFITDMGAGGLLNALKEVVFPAGAVVYFRRVPIGDKSITREGIMVAEYQESYVVLVRPDKWQQLVADCEREKVPLAAIGTVTGDGKIVVMDDDGTKFLDYDLGPVLGDFPQKTIEDRRRKLALKPLKLKGTLTVEEGTRETHKQLGVGSMEWANNMADDSVGGRVVQAKRVGPLGLPIADYALTASGVMEYRGQVNAVSQRQTIGLISPEAMSRMVASDVLVKHMFVELTKRSEIKLSANWMLAASLPGGIAWLYDAAKALEEFLLQIGIDIDGGKDSLSLAARVGNELVQSLRTLVLTTYAACPDFRIRITPDIKKPGQSRLLFVDLAQGKTRLGGSVLAQTQKQVGTRCPDVEDPETLTKTFDLMQELLNEGVLLSGHARGRGGLSRTLSEMAFAGNCGIEVNLKHNKASALAMLFNEELGFVIECLPGHEGYIKHRFDEAGLGEIVHSIGHTTLIKEILISFNGKIVLDRDMRDLRLDWRETSYFMSLRNTTRSCAEQERKNLYDQQKPPYILTFDPDLYKPVLDERKGRPRVAVLREEGTNSYREAWMALTLAGFEPWDVHVKDLLAGKISLRNFRGIFFPGGFSYKDALGSAVGFGAVLKFNPRIKAELDQFMARPDTFTIGICNGCQLMGILGMAPWKAQDRYQPMLYPNTSERFESRFPSVIILDSPAIALKHMAGSILGVHSAHGEGRVFVPTPGILKRILDEGLAPIRFADDYGKITERYPFNPNGSPLGITALCDRTGRHLMFMEHPERTVLKWQWKWWPPEWNHVMNSPWLRMFQNLRMWCEKTEDLSEEPVILLAAYE